MNVTELIAQLSKLDPSMRVVVSGYETGFDVVNNVKTITVKPWEPVTLDGWTEEHGDYDGELTQCKIGESGEAVAFLPRTSS